MKAHSRFDSLANFIISRAYILLFISLFLFPLIIPIKSYIADNYQKSSLFMPSINHTFLHLGIVELKSKTYKYRESRSPLPIKGDIYILSVLGWWTCPPTLIFFEKRKKKKKRQSRHLLSIWPSFHFEVALDYFTKSYLQPIIRTLFLLTLWLWSGQWLPAWLLALPIAEWLLTGICLAWPWLAQQLEIKGIRWLLSSTRLIILLALAAGLVWLWSKRQLGMSHFGLDLPSSSVVSVAGFVLSKQTKNSADSPQIWMEKLDQEDEYQIHLSGNFHFTLQSSDPFKKRMAIIFLRLLQSQETSSSGRPTRDGRRPIVSQKTLAKAFCVTQPEISRWEKYWLDKDWPNLLSLKSSQLLTVELREQIVELFARRPWWGVERVYEYLHQQGIQVTKSQIRQAAIESGWRHLRQTLNRFFVVSEESIRPRDEALLEQLLNQNKILLEKIENSEPLTEQEELDISLLQNAASELGVTSKPAEVGFWGQKIRDVLFSDSSDEKPIRCTSCGSDKVHKKGTKGYERRYFDENGEVKVSEVFPHYCDNPDCEKKTFTHLPEGLLPHSPYLLRVRLRALYLVAVLGGSYRRVAVALGVKSSRVYEWVSAFGQELLPVAALFGIVRSSGVVGIDEKYVQVPLKSPRGSGLRNKNSRRWMYVYFAIDVYTYDLLHIEIYAKNTRASTEAFLLALKAKGYRPRVIVTDLRAEYGPAIAKIFSGVRHHECIFHALQWISRQLKSIYGNDYKDKHPEVVELKEQILKIFNTTSKRIAMRRYQKVMSLEKTYVEKKTEVSAVFNTLERHWPKLINAIESTIIPKTNNAVELVIRRFDQLYQNFCGFETIESARIFICVFEKTYRFTPFTQDAQERIRGKCPLELAGYDIEHLPMSQLCRGWVVGKSPNSVEQAAQNVQNT
jgi:transposase